MKNGFLYFLTVFIWGSTWLAIEFQLGDVAVQASLTYRFGLSALLMMAYCLWKGLPMGFSLRDHVFIALLATANFSINYYLLYEAQAFLTSALASIVFSTMLLMNIVNTRLWFGTPIAPRIYLGAVIGVSGIVVLFLPQMFPFEWSNTSVVGVALALSGTLIASMGNMVSVRNSKRSLPIIQVNAWGMTYGAIIMAVITVIDGESFTISSEPAYWLSLLYLALFGSVIAFASYFKLLSTMGPEKASYVIVLFPVVAVILSSLFEDFTWTQTTVIGFLLVGLGNIIVLAPKRQLRQLFSWNKLLQLR